MRIVLLISLILFLWGFVGISWYYKAFNVSIIRFPDKYKYFSIDKFEHLIAAFVGTLLLLVFSNISILEGALWALLWGIVWEIKDGLLDYEIYGYWGGEGYDAIDLQYDMIGIIAACFLKWRLL